MDPLTEMSIYRPKPSDLVAFLPFACRELEAPFHLRILVETIEAHDTGKLAADDRGKKSKRAMTPQVQTSAGQGSVGREPSDADPDYGDPSDVVLRARCDPLGRPVELQFLDCAQVPRLLVKILGLCIPYNEQLVRIAVRRVQLDGAVLYEIAKFLPLSQLTEIHLDASPVTHRNYHMLLEQTSQLRSLSIARCDLADEECAALAVRLAPPTPASCGLASLSLESNHIGDHGARALGDALRTNRSLRHLNLAGNVITSLGAAHLFRSLMRFSVSGEELFLKRARTFEYLKLRRDAYDRCYRELVNSPAPAPESARSRSRSVTARSRRPSGADALASRAEGMAAELLGARVEPFDPTELETLSDTTYCAGNFSLSYLNLAYNELDGTSAVRLVELLTYQADAGCPARGPGLLRVVLEGNVLPGGCAAAAAVLLERALASAGPVQLLQLKPGRKSERPKLK